ncbi:LRR receptor-like serine/threonine-protein kinase GSO1-like [Planoprotostelium fungivorum]|uniref:LRR receptor-like serine/threonine-protein kinase GSO1-like n=1 Tax=Planoprotostelium fungivorum TaxID=1890364 RepID=A0A2P6NKK2_9EUKA|nr:LRR receptor-like serine/threonine-protein kinase GSO1-like [Planoprotostelium fungivorum]
MRGILLFLLAITSIAHAQQEDPAVRHSLENFFNITGGSTNINEGSSWWYSTNWTTSNNYCTWFGINCTEGILSGISVPDNGLHMNIDALLAIANLTTLVHLDLSQLDGFPPSLPDLSSLTQLEYLNLDSTSGLESLGSNLPPNLRTIILSNTQLSDIDAIYSLEQLNHLDLSSSTPSFTIDNQRLRRLPLDTLLLSQMGLSGHVPQTWLTVKELNLDRNMMSLNSLLVIGNKLNCSLETLSFQYNNDEGPLPDLSICPNLKTLFLSNNQYNGSLSSSFFDCNSLQYMNVQGNLLSQLGDMSSCRGLTTWKMESNLFITELPDISRMTLLTEFSASKNQFYGKIPDMFHDLSQLNWLDLRSNLLNDSIPPSIFHIPSLQYLYLSKNALYGKIPSFKNATGLIEIDVSYNELEGEVDVIPPFLQYLWLHYNDLSGTLPTPVSSLIGVDVSSNSFTGNIPDFTSAEYLSYFMAPGNHLNGSIPSNWPKFLSTLRLDGNQLSGNITSLPSNLLYINVDDNQLTGTISAISKATHISYISMRNNKFYGDLEPLRSLVGFRSLLGYVDLSQNELKGDVFEVKSKGFIFNAQRFSSLYYLNISYNQFEGAIFGHPYPIDDKYVTRNFTPDIISDFSFPQPIRVVDLSHNRFYGTPSIIERYEGGRPFYAQWESLNLSSNRLSGRAIEAILSLSYLNLLDLSDNNIGGIMSPAIATLEFLQELRLSNMSLMGRIPYSALQRLTDLQVLDLHDNQLESADLSWLNRMGSLESIDLSGNQIRSRLPPVTQLSQLSKLDLNRNFLSGNISDDYCRLSRLSYLGLSHNRLSGSVCTFSGDLTHLDLSDNSFNGDVSFISVLSSLQYLDLSSNSFSGQFPRLDRLARLQSANMSYNSLEGTLPPLNGLINMVSLDLSHNRLMKSIPSLDSDINLNAINFSYNMFSDAETFILPTNDTYCDMTGNTFECPISDDARNRCKAVCRATNLMEETISIKMDGDLSVFDSEKFLRALSQVLNCDSDRFQILNLRSGSVIVDLNIHPPSNISRDPSAVVLGSKMYTDAFRLEMQSEGYNITLVNEEIPSPPSLSGPNVALIVGLTVGLTALCVIVALFVLSRRRKPGKMYDQLMLVDMSKINLDPIKESVIPSKEITDMALIGSGAFGLVYSANWRNINVAVKQIRAELCDSQQVTNFLREVAILQHLRPHPNVVLFMGITLPPEPLSLVTEYCGGGSLFRKKFITQIAQGMLHLHLERIIHRDLAIRNILLTHHGDAKVADFGLSREQDESEGPAQVTATSVGPVRWMAPEAIKLRQYSTKSDVWSFGVLIWEMVAVKDPYPDKTTMEVAIGVSSGSLRLDIPEDTDPLLAELMTDCWQTDPQLRPNFRRICETLGVDTRGDVSREERSTDSPTAHNEHVGSITSEQAGYVGASAVSVDFGENSYEAETEGL